MVKKLVRTKPKYVLTQVRTNRVLLNKVNILAYYSSKNSNNTINVLNPGIGIPKRTAMEISGISTVLPATSAPNTSTPEDPSHADYIL